MPPDSQLKDLGAQMVLLDERGHDLEGQQPIPGVVIGDAFEFTGPTRVVWLLRWPFGRRSIGAEPLEPGAAAVPGDGRAPPRRKRTPSGATI